MAKKETVQSAIRMAGHLLETNRCWGREATNREGYNERFDSSYACRWCLTGALNVVSRKLGVDDVAVFNAVAAMFPVHSYTHLHRYWDAMVWSQLPGEGTTAIIKKLKEYTAK